MNMSVASHRLTAGQVRWLLDPDVPRGAATRYPRSSLPERISKLDDFVQEDQRAVDELNAETTLPTPLLADYDTATLRSQFVLPPLIKAYMKVFLETLVRDITIQTNLRFQLPSPLFRNEAHFRLETFIPNHRADLSTIAFDRTANTRLTLEQDGDAFSILKKTGVYKRGDFDITFSWYPGLEKIGMWRKQAWSESLFQWAVDVPSVVIGGDQSILLGLWQFISGWGITANRLTGVVPTWFPKYTRGEIDRECAKEYFRWLQDSEGFALIATEVIDIGCDRGRSTSMSARVERYPVIFKHPTRGTLDFRTSVPYIQMGLRRVLGQAIQKAETNIGNERIALITSLSRNRGEKEAIDVYLGMWHETYLEAVEDRRRAIDNLSSIPDLTDAVLNEQRARMLVARIVGAHRTEREAAIAAAMKVWTDNHPLKAASGKFVARQSANVTATVEDSIPLYDGIREAFLEADLDDLVLLIGTQLEFERSDALIERKKALSAAQKPGIVEFIFFKAPSQWRVQRRVIEDRTFYELQFVRIIQVMSSIPLWRLHAFVLRYCGWIWNSSFFLINKASIALRRWDISRKSFDIRLPSVVASTGQFDTTPIRTLRGRLEALLDWKQQVIQKAQNGEHIIRLRDGLYLDTCWAHVWTTMGVSVGATSIIGYTILETIVVVAGATFTLVTAPIWSLIGCCGYSLFNALVYDNELDVGHEGKAPLFQNIFGLQTVLVSTIRGVFHVLKGAAVAVGGEIRHGWNRLWHGLMTSLLKRAEVPTQAEGFFWSTSGPGMKNPFVLIDSDTTILALLSFLSHEELTVAREQMYSDLREPRRLLEERVREDSAHTMCLRDFQIVARALENTEESHRVDLGRFSHLSDTRQQYQDLLQGVKGNSFIRMTADELEACTSRALPVVKNFFIDRYFPRIRSSDMIRFWEGRNLAPGDWSGLTTRLLSDIFTDEIVVPFEAASDDLVVDANRASGLERVVEEALQEQGVVTGISTSYTVGHPVRNSVVPQAPDYEDLPIRFSPQPTE